MIGHMHEDRYLYTNELALFRAAGRQPEPGRDVEIPDPMPETCIMVDGVEVYWNIDDVFGANRSWDDNAGRIEVLRLDMAEQVYRPCGFAVVRPWPDEFQVSA